MTVPPGRRKGNLLTAEGCGPRRYRAMGYTTRGSR